MSDDVIVVYEPSTTVIVDSAPQDTVIVADQGIQGPPGPQGPPGSAGGTRFELDFIDSSDVIVTHNLGYIPVVMVILDSANAYPGVTHSSVNQCTVTLPSPDSGKVVCI